MLGSVRYVAVPHSAECGRRRMRVETARDVETSARIGQRDTCTCTGERRTESMCRDALFDASIQHGCVPDSLRGWRGGAPEARLELAY